MYSHLPFNKRKIITASPSLPSSSLPMEANESSNDEDVIMINNARSERKRIDAITTNNYFVNLENAFKGNLKTYYLKNNNSSVKDICMLLSLHKDEMAQMVL